MHAHAGLSAFINLLGSGGTVEQLEAALSGSAEYFQNRGGGTNDGFLAALYQDALGRPLDGSGRASFTQALANRATRADVAGFIVTSSEFRQGLVQDYYQRFLHRNADSVGLSLFVNAFQNGARDQDVIAAIIGSDEYFVRR